MALEYAPGVTLLVGGVLDGPPQAISPSPPATVAATNVRRLTRRGSAPSVIADGSPSHQPRTRPRPAADRQPLRVKWFRRRSGTTDGRGNRGSTAAGSSPSSFSRCRGTAMLAIPRWDVGPHPRGRSALLMRLSCPHRLANACCLRALLRSAKGPRRCSSAGNPWPIACAHVATRDRSLDP